MKSISIPRPSLMTVLPADNPVRQLNKSLQSTAILAVFPSFEAEPFGGVQISGKEALRSITGHSGIQATAFYHEPGQSKAQNLLQAIRSRTCADTLLIWHSGLLKLAPFIASSNRRLVLFLHGIEAWRKQDRLTSLMMRRTHLFLTNSEHTWRRFIQMHPCYASKPHRTVHLGLGEALPIASPRPDGIPSALMIGRLRKGENYKGHREMIEVWPQVLVSLPEAELRIVGAGDLQPELERLVQTLGLESRVRFYGAVPDSHKDDLLRQCRALVLPSAGEGFGLVYLEAMRMGRPCIVSTLDAGAEVVNPPEAGLAVNLQDPTQVASAIVTVLTPGAAWDEMSARARCRYESNFTARHFGERLQAALFDD
jgi:phosphatidylinositol alpha-1,6-mannosyltransferase